MSDNHRFFFFLLMAHVACFFGFFFLFLFFLLFFLFYPPSITKDCTSLSGACLTGRASTAICVCATNYYGCSNCAAKSSPVPSKTDPSGYKYV